MEFSENIMQEIEDDSKALLEELSLYSEEEKVIDNPTTNVEKQTSKQKSLLTKSNILLNKMKKNMNDEEYLIKGFNYHSKILYNVATKVPFVGKIIAVPLMAITKAVVNNVPVLSKMEQDKLLNLYTTQKGNLAAVNEKISKLEKLQKPNKQQKEELVLLKKMASETEMNMKRLEYNFKVSHIESSQANRKNPRYYTF